MSSILIVTEKLTKEITKKQNIMIFTEKLFFDKEKCDLIRDTCINSPLTMKQAVTVVEEEGDMHLNVKIAAAGACLGIQFELSLRIIEEINK